MSTQRTEDAESRAESFVPDDHGRTAETASATGEGDAIDRWLAGRDGEGPGFRPHTAAEARTLDIPASDEDTGHGGAHDGQPERFGTDVCLRCGERHSVRELDPVSWFCERCLVMAGEDER